MLSRAAVIGRRFDYGLLRALLDDLTDEQCLAALDELLSGQLLMEVGQPVGPSRYPFAHRMIWEVVYEDAGDARRRHFHRRIVAILTAAGEPAACSSIPVTPNRFDGA